MLEETGMDYVLKSVRFDTGETRHPDFLSLNPIGKVPVLVDGELILFESLAINMHLAQRYARAHHDGRATSDVPALWPENPDHQSQLYQWLAWAMGELEGPHDFANRTGGNIDEQNLTRSLDALGDALGSQEYLLGQTFTVADLNTACVLLRPLYRDVARTDERLAGWFRRCTERPALQRALAG